MDRPGHQEGLLGLRRRGRLQLRWLEHDPDDQLRQNAGDPLFKTPPGCLFLHQASFITGLGAFKALKAGTDYNFFPFPDINTQFTGGLEGAGDLFGMFHDTPQAHALMQWLVTPEAQQIWVSRGGAISANKAVTTYPDDIAKRSADLWPTPSRSSSTRRTSCRAP